MCCMTPKVTVLITVYNALPFLSEAIESVLTQTFRYFELLIIDDASTDGSAKLIQSYQDPRIRFLPNTENLGTAGSMNRGIAEAHASVIMRMDHDDVSTPTRLERQLEYLNTHPEVAAVCSWEHTIDERGRVMRSWRAEIKNRGQFFGPLLLGLCPIWHPSLMVRTEAVRSIGGFIATSWPAEDFDVTMRLALAGFGAAVVPEFLLLQRQHRKRQSIQSEQRQKDATARLHSEMIQKFSPDPKRADALSRLLRLESPVRAITKSKRELLTLFALLDQTLKRAGQTLEFTPAEHHAMVAVVNRRLGWGPRVGRTLSSLPSPLWWTVFFLGSPMLFGRLRTLASACYRWLCLLRHPRQFFQ